jgi:hypothetical protein
MNKLRADWEIQGPHVKPSLSIRQAQSSEWQKYLPSGCVGHATREPCHSPLKTWGCAITFLKRTICLIFSSGLWARKIVWSLICMLEENRKGEN